jgi:hypothetical protein
LRERKKEIQPIEEKIYTAIATIGSNKAGSSYDLAWFNGKNLTRAKI